MKASADEILKVIATNRKATHDFHIFWSFLPEAADALGGAGRFARDIRAAGDGHGATGDDAAGESATGP